MRVPQGDFKVFANHSSVIFRGLSLTTETRDALVLVPQRKLQGLLIRKSRTYNSGQK